MVHSLDDPVCIPESIPFRKIKDNPNLFMVLTQKGGHVEWLTGAGARRWAFKPAVEFLTYQAKKQGYME